MNLEEMAADYEKRTGEKAQIPNDYHLTTTDSGFFMWKIKWPILWLNQVYGDGKYWRDYAHSLAFLFGCKYMRTYTRRNPKAFIRKWGARVISEANYPNYTEYLLELGVTF